MYAGSSTIDRHPAPSNWAIHGTVRAAVHWTIRPAGASVAAVHGIVAWAPVGPLDRGQRTVGGNVEGDQQRAQPVLGSAQQPPHKLPGHRRRMGAANTEVGGSMTLMRGSHPRV